jgi:hypothetical protein
MSSETLDINANAVSILDSDGNMIKSGNKYKIRAADGSELGIGRLGEPLGPFTVFGMGPTNSGVPFFIKNDCWNSYYHTQIYVRDGDQDKCAAPFRIVTSNPLNPTYYLAPATPDGSDYQKVTGIKGSGNTVWIKMKTAGGLHVTANSDRDIVNYITCRGSGYGFEVSFVKIPE